MGSVRWLTGAGIVLVAVAIALAFLERPSPTVALFALPGVACLLVSVLLGRASEGSVEAGGGGLKLSWKQEITRSVGQVIEAEVATVQQEGDSSADPGFALRRYSQVHFADVNNDGDSELLIEHPVGAHGRVLKVFGWTEESVLPEFGMLAQVSCGLGGPFTIGDLDDDGLVEVAMIEVDWSKEGAFSAGGPFVEILYEWEDEQGFVEVGRNEIGSPKDFSGVDFKWYRWEGPVQ